MGWKGRARHGLGWIGQACTVRLVKVRAGVAECGVACGVWSVSGWRGVLRSDVAVKEWPGMDRPSAGKVWRVRTTAPLLRPCARCGVVGVCWRVYGVTSVGSHKYEWRCVACQSRHEASHRQRSDQAEEDDGCRG